MKAISDTLIHFLGRAYKNDHSKQLEIFKNIIKNGLTTSTVDVVFSDGRKIWAKCVCFTDMPLNFCDEQTAVYGKFGIGFKKSFVKRLGGNPVRYFVDYPVSFEGPNLDCRGVFLWHLDKLAELTGRIDSHILKEKTGLFNKANKEIVTLNDLTDYCNVLLYILGHEKPTGDLGPARNDTEEEDVYYKEREWRLTPSNVAKNAFQELIKTVNENDHEIRFNREDIRVIIVPSVNIKKEVVNFLRSLNSDDLRLKSFEDDLPAILIYDELKYF